MNKYLSKNLSFFSFIFIPILYFWDPHWIGLMGVNPYWSLFWLLPWAIIHGPINGIITGLFLGITLDALSTENSFTEIPGLVLCGFWFGKIGEYKNGLIGHLRYGLVCCLGSLICSFLYYIQIIYNNFPEFSYIFLFSGTKNIFSQLIVTGLIAPLFCSLLFQLFKKYNPSTF